jgi:nucleotide-binding universal stress UspA family protein
MFQRILIPMSSENFPDKALKRAVSLSKKTGCEVDLLFVVEEKALSAIEVASEYALAQDERGVVVKQAVDAQTREARNIIIDEAKKILGEKGAKVAKVIKRGVFTPEILREAKRLKSDVILMEYCPDAFLRYRIFMRAKIPIWVERGKSMKKILAVLTNLAPNKVVPEVAARLARIYRSEVFLLYVIDLKEKGHKMDSSKAKKEAAGKMAEFKAKNPDITVKTSVRTGSMDKVAERVARKYDPGTVILGRFKKIRKYLMFSRSDLKDHFCRKAPYNIILVKPLKRR